MHSRRLVLRVVIAPLVVLASLAYSFEQEPARGVDLDSSRLVASEPLPEMLDACTWDMAAPERPALQSRGSGAGAVEPAMGDPTVAARMPIRTIRDPYAGFAAIRVDPVRNEVVIMDEFKFNIYVYDR